MMRVRRVSIIRTVRTVRQSRVDVHMGMGGLFDAQSALKMSMSLVEITDPASDLVASDVADCVQHLAAGFMAAHLVVSSHGILFGEHTVDDPIAITTSSVSIIQMLHGGNHVRLAMHIAAAS